MTPKFPIENTDPLTWKQWLALIIILSIVFSPIIIAVMSYLIYG